MVDRSRSIRVPVTEDEIRMARELAEVHGKGVASLLRTLIRSAHAAQIAPPKPKAKAKRRR